MAISTNSQLLESRYTPYRIPENRFAMAEKLQERYNTAYDNLLKTEQSAYGFAHNIQDREYAKTIEEEIKNKFGELKSGLKDTNDIKGTARDLYDYTNSLATDERLKILASRNEYNNLYNKSLYTNVNRDLAHREKLKSLSANPVINPETGEFNYDPYSGVIIADRPDSIKDIRELMSLINTKKSTDIYGASISMNEDGSYNIPGLMTEQNEKFTKEQVANYLKEAYLNQADVQNYIASRRQYDPDYNGEDLISQVDAISKASEVNNSKRNFNPLNTDSEGNNPQLIDEFNTNLRDKLGVQQSDVVMSINDRMNHDPEMVKESLTNISSQLTNKEGTGLLDNLQFNNGEDTVPLSSIITKNQDGTFKPLKLDNNGNYNFNNFSQLNPETGKVESLPPQKLNQVNQLIQEYNHKQSQINKIHKKALTQTGLTEEKYNEIKDIPKYIEMFYGMSEERKEEYIQSIKSTMGGGKNPSPYFVGVSELSAYFQSLGMAAEQIAGKTKTWFAKQFYDITNDNKLSKLDEYESKFEDEWKKEFRKSTEEVHLKVVDYSKDYDEVYSKLSTDERSVIESGLVQSLRYFKHVDEEAKTNLIGVLEGASAIYDKNTGTKVSLDQIASLISDGELSLEDWGQTIAGNVEGNTKGVTYNKATSSYQMFLTIDKKNIEESEGDGTEKHNDFKRIELVIENPAITRNALAIEGKKTYPEFREDIKNDLRSTGGFISKTFGDIGYQIEEIKDSQGRGTDKYHFRMTGYDPKTGPVYINSDANNNRFYRAEGYPLEDVTNIVKNGINKNLERRSQGGDIVGK